MVKLRKGVELIRGHKRKGSAYYLVDDVLCREYHIDNDFATYLRGLARKELNENKIKKYKKFLYQYSLTDDRVAVKPQPSLLDTLLFIPLELFNPTNFLGKCKQKWSWLFSRAGYLSLCVLFLISIFLLKGHWFEFLSFFERYYSAPVTIIFGLVIVKLLHELGHAGALIKHGAQARSIGVMFVGFFPLPKTFAHRLCLLSPKQRLEVALAGVYIEAWVACFCVFLWLIADTPSIKVMAHFLAVVSFTMTVSINLLPLLKFDGYQGISAILDSPKLYENALFVFKKKLYVCLGKVAPNEYISSNISERVLFLYGMVIMFWRVLLPFFIGASSVAFFGRLGFIVMFLACYIILVRPGLRELRKMKMASESQHRVIFKSRVIGCFLLTMLLWFVLPLSHTEKYKGVVVLEQQHIVSEVDGILLKQKPESYVDKGEELLRLVVLDEDKDKKNYFIQESLLNESALERQHYSQLSIIEDEKSKRLITQTVIDSKNQGYWVPEPFKSNIRLGDKLGTVYYDHSLLRLFLPENRFKNNSSYRVSVAFPGRGLQDYQVNSIGPALNLNLLPAWMPLKNKNYLIFESEFDAEQESVVDVYVDRSYSLAYELFEKFFIIIFRAS